MKKEIKKLKQRRNQLLEGLINATNDDLRSVYQFKIYQIENAIMTLEREI